MIMGTVSAMRRTAAGAQPPQSAARAKLAELIEADHRAAERLRTLDTVRSRAYAAFEAAETALTEARETVEQAAAHAHEHLVASLLDDKPPAFPTRRDAAAKLAAAQDAASDAEAAWRAIGAEAETLRNSARDRQDRITEAAEAVMREECQATVPALVQELNDLHAKVVERHKLLQWMIQNHITDDWGPKAQPGVGELTMRAQQHPMNWSLWRGEPAAVAQWAATLAALRRDASAEVPR